MKLSHSVFNLANVKSKNKIEKYLLIREKYLKAKDCKFRVVNRFLFRFSIVFKNDRFFFG